MGKRGPRPPDFGLLSFWEFEFYKAFHLLRDGTPLPSRDGLTASGLSPQELRSFIQRLAVMTADEYWLTTRRLAVEMGERRHLRRPPRSMDRHWAEEQRNQEIFQLKQALKPMEHRVRRRKLWRELVEADTYSTLRKLCGRWARLPEARGLGLQPFPGHLLANAASFFSMKRNKRFPRSDYGDDARMEYLARGMAGVMAGKSPMTAIERLRNMKHGHDGPLWDKDGYCRCWRCSLSRAQKAEETTQGWYENGLKLFMQLAATTRVPIEWKKGSKPWKR